MKLKSSEPFWLVKNGLLHSYPSLSGDIEADILIIGGGITGALMAHQCMNDGYHTVLADRREVAQGSTSATTSMLQYETDMPLYRLLQLHGEKAAVNVYRSCFNAIGTLSGIVREIASDAGFEEKDSFYFAARKKDIPWLRQELDARRAHGFPVRWLSAGEAQERYGLQHTQGGILSAGAAAIDAFHFTHDLLAFHHKKGLQIFDKTDILRVRHTRQGIEAITEYGNRIRARRLIWCGGYESVRLIPEEPVRLFSTWAIAGERCAQNLKHLQHTLFWNTSSPYTYLRATDDNRLLIGGADEDFVNAELRDALLAKKAAQLEKYLHRILPGVPFRTDFVWAGTFGNTPDSLPYVGTHPGYPHTYFVLGFGGNGITFSLCAMEMISAMLRKKKHPLMPVFRFGRYGPHAGAVNPGAL